MQVIHALGRVALFPAGQITRTAAARCESVTSARLDLEVKATTGSVRCRWQFGHDGKLRMVWQGTTGD